MYYPTYKKYLDFTNQIGLVFFGQCLDELLFNHTIDSYKAPATNLHTNLYELYKLLRHHKEGRIKRGSLQHVIDEILYKIKDNVVYKKIPASINSLAKIIKLGKIDFSDLTTHVNIVINQLRETYLKITIDRIKNEIQNIQPNYEDIYKLAIEFVIQVEMHGFSRTFIYFETQKFFFNPACSPKKIKNNTDIDLFFKRFESKDKTWDILLKSTTNITLFKQFQEKFHIEIIEDVLPEYNKNEKTNDFFISTPKYDKYILVKNVKANDPFNARLNAIWHVDMFLDICQFHDHINIPSISNDCIVHDVERDAIFSLKEEPSPMDVWEPEYIISVNENIYGTIELLTGERFTSKSRFAFSKALDFHRSALSTKIPEIQLINIWAAIEGFLPPPSKDDDRIVHYLNILVPPLTLTYSEKIFKYMADGILSYEKSARIIEEYNVVESKFDKIVSILTCADVKEFRDRLFSVLAEHPLLLYRCIKISNDFNSRRNINAGIRKHIHRLELHIQRIYTLRNLIVHTAESLPYVKTLIFNIHNYFDTLINSISTTGSYFKIKNITIQTAINFLQSHYNIYLEELGDENDDVTLNNYKDIIFGNSNILSPYKK